MRFDGSILLKNALLQSIELLVWEGGRNVRYQLVIVLYDSIYKQEYTPLVSKLARSRERLTVSFKGTDPFQFD